MTLHSIQFNHIASYYIHTDSCVHFVVFQARAQYAIFKETFRCFQQFFSQDITKDSLLQPLYWLWHRMLLTTLAPASVQYEKLLQQTLRPTRRHERHKLDHNRPSSASIPHPPCCSQRDYVFLVFQKTQRLQASIDFLHKLLDENIFEQLLFRRHRFLLHTKAHNNSWALMSPSPFKQ